MNARKALIAASRQNRPEAGVYQLSTPQGDRYWGKAPNLPAAKNRHEFQLRAGVHPETDLQTAWNQGGDAAVIFEVIATVSSTKDQTDAQRRDDLQALWELLLDDPRRQGSTPIRLLKQ